MSSIPLTALRWVYAAFFLAVGLYIVASLAGVAGGPPTQPTRAAQAFTDALSRSGFVDPLLAAGYIVGGLALLRRAWAPLGLVVLSPAVVGIALFHFVLSGQFAPGAILAAIHALLAWQFRARFACLWREGRLTDPA